MNEPRLDPAWSALHLRKARGESLTDEERAVYEAGLRELEAGESYPGDLEELRRLRAELQRLRAEHAELEAQRAAFDQEIARLEANLSRRAKELLGVED
jgi:septal ring factor EnvC (AmiA/AmiB activator)